MSSTFDLSTVSYVKRIKIGNDNPQTVYTEEMAAKDMNLLNRCLNDFPKGHIIASEKNFAVFNIGEHQVVLQWIVYHIGFNRKPMWLE